MKKGREQRGRRTGKGARVTKAHEEMAVWIFYHGDNCFLTLRESLNFM